MHIVKYIKKTFYFAIGIILIFTLFNFILSNLGKYEKSYACEGFLIKKTISSKSKSEVFFKISFYRWIYFRNDELGIIEIEIPNYLAFDWYFLHEYTVNNITIWKFGDRNLRGRISVLSDTINVQINKDVVYDGECRLKK